MQLGIVELVKLGQEGGWLDFFALWQGGHKG